MKNKYWSRVFREAVRIIRETPAISATEAYKIARINVDNEDPQTCLTFTKLKRQLAAL